MRCIIFSVATISQTESNLFNVDVLYRESSLDEFRVEPMKSTSERRESRVIAHVLRIIDFIRPSRDFSEVWKKKYFKYEL